MRLKLVDLDARTRNFMLDEFDSDHNVYRSPRLRPNAMGDYVGLLRRALKESDEGWLAGEIRRSNLIREHDDRGNKVPFNAAETLACDQFNRYYMRALCLRAIEDGIEELEVYRARDVDEARGESLQMVGRRFAPGFLLEVLRAEIGSATALKFPPGPNSGLSLRIPRS